MTPISADQTPILGQSPAFLDLLDQVSRAAPLDRPVLVIGERGTGKELIAARLHYLSTRWDQSFIKLNCAALPESLLESELFGHEAGAFTGAARQRAGRFEMADQGSLFLDEIGTMSMAAQEKLLRIIEYGEFERLGGSKTLQVDTRVIGATNIDLPACAENGSFRFDLLDRLAFDVLTVPPLRVRIPDILELAQHFAIAITRELGWDGFPGFAKKAEKKLIAYPWPGNVRELKNVVERAVYRHGSEGGKIEEIIFDPFDSPWRPEKPGAKEAGQKGPEKATKEEWIPDASHPLDFREAVAETEKRLLERALTANRFNQRQTATHLNLTYDQLRHAMKKHGLLEPTV